MVNEPCIVPTPELVGSDPVLRLAELYEKLGSPAPERVDPDRVRMNPVDLVKLTGEAISHSENLDDRVAIGIIYAGRGPSGDTEVPSGMVLLVDGWTKPMHVSEVIAASCRRCLSAGCGDTEGKGKIRRH